jgi:hypothetical protein
MKETTATSGTWNHKSNAMLSNNRLHRAYRAVDWVLRQPGNHEKQVVVVPKWAIYTLIEACQARNAGKHESQMRLILLLSGLLLVSVGILLGIVLFGG